MISLILKSVYLNTGDRLLVNLEGLFYPPGYLELNPTLSCNIKELNLTLFNLVVVELRV
jgi:hypothetical protein